MAIKNVAEMGFALAITPQNESNFNYHNRMYCSDAGTCQHHDRQFQNHRHVYRYGITSFDTMRSKYVGEAASFLQQFFVRNTRIVIWVIAFPVKKINVIAARAETHTERDKETLEDFFSQILVLLFTKSN